MDARPQGLDRARNIMHQSRRGARCARLARWRRNPARAHRRVEEIRDEWRLPPPAGEQAEVNERGEGEEQARRSFHAGEGSTGWKGRKGRGEGKQKRRPWKVDVSGVSKRPNGLTVKEDNELALPTPPPGCIPLTKGCLQSPRRLKHRGSLQKHPALVCPLEHARRHSG